MLQKKSSVFRYRKYSRKNLVKCGYWCRKNSMLDCSALHKLSSYVLNHIDNIMTITVLGGGPVSSVGIKTDHGLDGPGSNPGGGRDFPPVQTGPGAHSACCKMGTGSFPGVKCGRGVLLTTHPLLMQRSWKSRAIPLPTLWATPGL